MRRSLRSYDAFPADNPRPPQLLHWSPPNLTSHMPQSLSKIYLHLVFSTKNRERRVDHGHRTGLHAYMAGILKGLECMPIEINTEPDHAHVLFLLGRTRTVSEVVGHLKKSSTDWLRGQHQAFRGFHWQTGYGCFSVSESSVTAVRNYIRDQQEHHKLRSFQDEYRELLQRYDVGFDERYVWD
jgi:putative transposase